MGSSSNFYSSASSITVSLTNIEQVAALPTASTYSGGTVIFDQAAGKMYEQASGSWAQQQAIGLGATFVATLAALQALSPASNSTVVTAGRTTAGDGGGGVWAWDPADHSTDVTNDTKYGVYVAPPSDTTGASGAWRRVNHNRTARPRWFGAVADWNGSTGTDDSAALQACSDWAHYAGWHVDWGADRFKCTAVKVYSKTLYLGAGIDATEFHSESNNAVFASANYSSYNSVTSPAGHLHMARFTVSGSDNSSNTQETGIIMRDYYSTLDHIRVKNCGGDGFLITENNSSGTAVSSTLVENRFTNLAASNNYGIGFQNGATSSSTKLTDGFMDRVTIDTQSTSVAGVRLWTSAGWTVNALHVYGSPTAYCLDLRSVFHTSLSNIYLEDAGTDALYAQVQEGFQITNIRAGTSGSHMLNLTRPASSNTGDVSICGLFAYNNASTTATSVYVSAGAGGTPTVKVYGYAHYSSGGGTISSSNNLTNVTFT